MTPLRTPKEVGIAIKTFARHGAPERSHSLLREASVLGLSDLISFNSVLDAYARQGQWEPALDLLDEMNGGDARQPPPDVISLNSALSALAKARPRGSQWRRALELLEDYSSPSSAVVPNAVSYTTTLCVLGPAGKWDEAMDILARMHAESSAAAAAEGASAAAASGPASSGPAPAAEAVSIGAYAAALGASPLPRVERELALLDELRRRGVPPDLPSYRLAIYTAKEAANASVACRLLDEAVELGLSPDEAIYSAALGACGRARAWDEQYRVYCLARERDGIDVGVVSATMVLSSASRSGNWRRALQVFDDIRSRRPGGLDLACYSAAVDACEVGGQWERALRLLVELRREGLVPDHACYTSAMQAMCASGRADEGWALLGQMEADGLHLSDEAYPAHRALVEAFRARGDDRRAREVLALCKARGLSARDAKAGTRSTSNFYNKERPERRKPTLAAAVRSLSDELVRSTAYKPQFQALPFAFTKGRSQGALRQSLQSHAEKKALVSLLQRKVPELELSINFHVCVDCHEFMKAASARLGRPITVREPKMTHRFEGGACSCGDSWRWETRAAGANPKSLKLKK